MRQYAINQDKTRRLLRLEVAQQRHQSRRPRCQKSLVKCYFFPLLEAELAFSKLTILTFSTSICCELSNLTLTSLSMKVHTSSQKRYVSRCPCDHASVSRRHRISQGLAQIDKRRAESLETTRRRPTKDRKRSAGRHR